MSFALRTILLVIVLTSASLLILLSISSANTNQLGKQYTWLVIANVFIAVTMITVTLLLIRRAWLRYKGGVFGSRLMIRLAVAFVDVRETSSHLVPAALLKSTLRFTISHHERYHCIRHTTLKNQLRHNTTIITTRHFDRLVCATEMLIWHRISSF